MIIRTTSGDPHHNNFELDVLFEDSLNKLTIKAGDCRFRGKDYSIEDMEFTFPHLDEDQLSILYLVSDDSNILFHLHHGSKAPKFRKLKLTYLHSVAVINMMANSPVSSDQIKVYKINKLKVPKKPIKPADSANGLS